MRLADLGIALLFLILFAFALYASATRDEAARSAVVECNRYWRAEYDRLRPPQIYNVTNVTLLQVNSSWLSQAPQE